MDPRAHWENVYQTKSATKVSWYAPHLDQSLQFILRLGRTAEIIDVGGGASTLVDDLLSAGFERVTVLDIAQAALDIARSRLGVRAAAVAWIEADITDCSLPADKYQVWHDRAVFHFLTQENQRKAYVDTVRRAVKSGGLMMIAAFAPEGPARCSGLDIVRYDEKSLSREFGAGFTLLDVQNISHVTPSGSEQRFIACRFRKR